MFKTLTKYLSDYHFLPCFLKKLLTYYFEPNGVSIQQRKIPLIISLSSSEENFSELKYSIYSLLNQKIRPDKVILWLDDTIDLLDLPYDITKYIKKGLEVRFAAELDSYTKIINPLKDYPNAIIVTAEDNIFYPHNWLENLYHSYISNPNDIHSHKAKIINFDGKNFKSTEEWKTANKEDAKYHNIPINDFGVLYPPACFSKEVFREDIYKDIVPNEEFIWLWFMAVISNRKVRVVKNHIKKFLCINPIKKFKSYITNCTSLKIYDKKFEYLMKYYEQNIKLKLKYQ